MNRRSVSHEYLQGQAEGHLTMRGIPYLHLTTAVTRKLWGRFVTLPVPGMKGWPDLLIFHGAGRVVFVEFKTGAARMSTEQRHLCARLEMAGYRWYVVRSFEEFKEIAAGFSGKEEAA